MNLSLRLENFIDEFKRNTRDKLIPFVVLNSILILLQTLYINARFSYVNSQIPFWYTKPWGNYQLATKDHLYYIPILATGILIFGIILFILLNRLFIRYLADVFGFLLTITNILLMYSIYKIIGSASIPFEPLIDPRYLSLFIPFIVGFGAVYYLMPVFIDWAFDRNLVTNPIVHEHPGMALSKPSARGGGFFYALVFFLISLIFLGLNTNLMGFYLSLIMLAVLGIIDDIQNTNVKSSFRLLENPLLRLVLIFFSVLPVIFSNIRFEFVTNPFGGTFFLDTLSISVMGVQIPVLSAFLTIVWIVWVMNLLSWSNGIDGQFSGIMLVSSLIVGFLALRFEPLLESQRQVAVMAVISGGISLGFIKYTWNPSKIMWGFGALTAGLVLSVMSILIQGKVVTSVMIILIPFLDAVVTAVRRILQGKNPLKGDRGHLHHLLLERGWSPKKIAVFYWLSTLLFGVLGILTAERNSFLAAFIIIGIVAFFIVLLNVISAKGKNRQSAIESESQI